jgi:hypothetical protein
MKTRNFLNATLVLLIQILSVGASAEIHYTCDFSLKSGEVLRTFSFSTIKWIEVQSSTRETEIIQNVRMIENKSTLSFRSANRELLSIKKGKEGAKVAGRLIHNVEGKVAGICSSFEDIGP